MKPSERHDLRLPTNPRTRQRLADLYSKISRAIRRNDGHEVSALIDAAERLIRGSVPVEDSQS